MGVFSTLLGSSGGSSSSSFIDPNQEPYLKQLYGGANNALQTALQTGPYEGRLYADLDALQRAGVDSAAGYAQGVGSQAAGAAGAAGLGLLNSGAQFGANAQSVFSGVQGPNALFANAFNTANGAEADALVAAAGRDTVRGLTEGALPQINRNAALTGNRGSTRTGIQAAVAERGANDRLADISADVRRGLFNDTFSQGLQANESATNQRLAANSQLAQAFGAGIGGLGSGFQFAGDNSNLLTTAGGLLQGDRQARLDEDRAQFDLRRNDLFDVYGAFGGLIGPPTVLNQSQTTNPDPGALSRVAGGLKSIGSIGSSLASGASKVAGLF